MVAMTDRERDSAIAEKWFGWTWIQPPEVDYDGLIPDQGLCIVDPQMRMLIEKGQYRWPNYGVISPLFFNPPHFSADPSASKDLRAKLAETYDWLLGDGTAKPGEPRFGFALFKKNALHGKRTTQPLFTAESDISEERAVAECAMKAKP